MKPVPEHDIYRIPPGCVHPDMVAVGMTCDMLKKRAHARFMVWGHEAKRYCEDPHFKLSQVNSVKTS